MTVADYENILAALQIASRVLDSSKEELNATDIRIRCLVNITTKETRRAQLEIGRPAQCEADQRPSPEDSPANILATEPPQ